MRLSSLFLCLAICAAADPLTLTFSGTGNGSLGGTQFTNASFTFTFQSDTSQLTSCCGSGASTPSGTPATVSINGTPAVLMDNQAVFVNPTELDIGIWHFGSPDYLTIGNSAFGSYALNSSIGPISGTTFALGNAMATSAGNLLLTSVSGVTFTATVGAASTTGTGITTPAPGSALTSPSDTFFWNAVSGADQYRLDAGSSPGLADYFSQTTTATSLEIDSLPCDGRTVSVQLSAHLNGAWQTPQQFTYTAASGCAALITPANLSTLGATAVFLWAPILGADQYRLDLGSSIGANDLFSQTTALVTLTIANLPTDGRTIYAQLSTEIGGVWQNPGRYTLRAGSPAAIALAKGGDCNGTFGGRIDGDISVQGGDTCVVMNATVSGDIKVHGGDLILNDTTVNGDVTVGNGGMISIGPGTVIHGDLDIHDTAASSSKNQLCGARVDGDAQIQNNSSIFVIGASSATACAANQFEGSLQVHDNDDVRVFNNSIKDELQCEHNSAIIGGGNSAKKKHGQCSGF